MKRTIIFSAVVIAALFLASCGKIKDTGTSPNNPANPNEGAPGGVDNSTYPFETDSDLAGITLSGGGFTDTSISTVKAYMGSASVKITVLFDAPNKQGRLDRAGITLSTLTGKVISGHIWVPNGMFASSVPYGCFFYMQFDSSNNSDWYQSTWQNLSAPTGAIKGQWNALAVNVDSAMTLQNGNGQAGHLNGNTLSQNSVSTSLPVKLGIVVGQSGDAASTGYTGYIYIDSINIQ
jgi:hypothetical protein